MFMPGVCSFSTSGWYMRPALSRAGGVITLTVGDAHYRPELSNMTWPLAAGTRAYAQVDAVNPATTYGAVLENHEITGGVYNNIASTTSIASSAQIAQAAPVVKASSPSPAHLPLRR